jgi:uncharacterized NAD(P)/FAD-binding protein YdhS
MSVSRSAALRVVILGGGFTGASLAWQLARMRLPLASLTVVEPRPELGRGLAYSATDPAHRINVSAPRMSIDPENRGDFAEWLAENPDVLDARAVTANGDVYPQRELFGRYVADRLAPHLQSGAVRHICARVSDIQRDGEDSLLLLLSDDSRIHADLLVLATGHPAPAVPRALSGIAAASGLIADPSDAAALAGIPSDARVLILGAALTAADVVTTLERQGHRGGITCLSRHGLRSRGNALVRQDSDADFLDPPIGSATELLRRVRHAIVDDQARGLGWHATFYRLREQGAAIWAGLGDDGRRRLLRHMRTWWDVHRYRLPPQTEAVVERLTAAGRLRFLAGHLLAAQEAAEGELRIDWRPRGSERPLSQSFDRVIVTTGPAQDRCIGSNPALGALERLGLIAPCPLGLGLATTDSCLAIRADGHPGEQILVAGPLARGHIGELVGVPECAAQAREIARRIARHALLGSVLRNPAGIRSGSAALAS